MTPGKVVMLVGADGDRDATKRHDMGRTAVEGSDILVITDHHPRFEDPESIRATLIEGARRARPDAEIHEYSPPERAIVEAVKLVGDGDAILWAGPGHQDYRDIRGVRTPYSARELARRALRDAGWPVPEPHWPVPYPTDATPLSEPSREWRRWSSRHARPTPSRPTGARRSPGLRHPAPTTPPRRATRG